VHSAGEYLLRSIDACTTSSTAATTAATSMFVCVLFVDFRSLSYSTTGIPLFPSFTVPWFNLIA
jgi:hypothetical protein